MRAGWDPDARRSSAMAQVTQSVTWARLARRTCKACGTSCAPLYGSLYGRPRPVRCTAPRPSSPVQVRATYLVPLSEKGLSVYNTACGGGVTAEEASALGLAGASCFVSLPPSAPGVSTMC